MIILPILTTSLIHFSLEGWENVDPGARDRFTALTASWSLNFLFIGHDGRDVLYCTAGCICRPAAGQSDNNSSTFPDKLDAAASSGLASLWGCRNQTNWTRRPRVDLHRCGAVEKQHQAAAASDPERTVRTIHPDPDEDAGSSALPEL